MTQVTPRQLEYLVATIETGTVTGAAVACHVSQSAVSVGLRELERVVGAQLFVEDRSRGMAPTLAGRALAARATEVLALLDALPDTARRHAPGLIGLVRIGCFEALSPLLLPDFVAESAERHPGLQVDFVEGSIRELAPRLRLGELDAIVGARNQLPGDLAVEHIFTTPFYVVLAADHPLARRDSVSFAELADLPAIFLDLPPTAERLDALIRGTGVTPRIRWRSRSMGTVQALVGRGLGYTVVNVRHPDSTPQGHAVVHLPIEDDLPLSGISVAWRSGPASANVRAFIDHLHANAHRWRIDGGEPGGSGAPVRDA